MKPLGNILYVSKLGLGVEVELPLFTENNKLYVESLLTGNLIEVCWLEEGKSVQSIYDRNTTN